MKVSEERCARASVLSSISLGAGSSLFRICTTNFALKINHKMYLIDINLQTETKRKRKHLIFDSLINHVIAVQCFKVDSTLAATS
jgi:hypothetical protein